MLVRIDKLKQVGRWGNLRVVHLAFAEHDLICAVQFFSSSHSFTRALRERGCRIGYEAKTMSRDHFWLSMSRDTNVEVSALGVGSLLHRVFP